MRPRRPEYRNPAYQRPSLRPQPVSPHSVWFKRMTRKEFLATLGAVVVGVLLFTFFEHHHAGKQPAVGANVPRSAASSFNIKQYSLTDPNSNWVIVNKPHGLSPINYTPPDLVTPNIPLRVPGNESMEVRQVTATALEKLVVDAKTSGLSLMLASGYRSYSYQVGLYNGYVQSQGQASADQSSARPGHSEHQTGLAADIEPASKNCELEACFGHLPEGKWLADNAYKYGFIIRYTAGKVPITGYEYEPWHVRYVGVDLATQMHDTHIETLEEFFGVSGGTSYTQ